MSALAQLALARGARVSGSDLHADPHENPAVARMLAAGAAISARHDATRMPARLDLLVATAAVSDENPELNAARKRGVRVVSRAVFLGELMAAHEGIRIAVAGTHGKTTTTGMLGLICQEAGLDPTIFVGGEVPALGGNVRIGSPAGPFIAEACEAYDSFQSLAPDIAVLTNVEADHLDHYGTLDALLSSFARLVRRASRGVVVANGDDAGARSVIGLAARGEREDGGVSAGISPDESRSTWRMVWFSADAAADAHSRADTIELDARARFYWHESGQSTPIRLAVPGRHNVMNALAAATAARELGVAPATVAAALSRFTGAGRRQEVLGERGGDSVPHVLVIDDYAHHPTEIRATIDAIRQGYPRRRLVAVFQPHLYSRTRDFLEPFADALSEADAVIVTGIYPAREAPIPGVTARAIADGVHSRRPGMVVRYVEPASQVPAALDEIALPDDVALFLGAGDIRSQAERFLHGQNGFTDVPHGAEPESAGELS